MSINLLLNRLFELPSGYKNALAMVWDLCCLVLAFVGSYWIRLGIDTETLGLHEVYLAVSVVIFHMSALLFAGHYQHVIRHITLKAILIALMTNTAASVYLFVAKYPLDAFVPVSLPVIYFVFASVGMLLPRVIIMLTVQGQNFKLREKCLIFGAGQTGRALAASLLHDSEMLPVAFIDDKSAKQGKTILGLDVYSKDMVPQLAKRYGVTKLLMAVNNCSATRRRELIQELEPYAIELLSVPDMNDILFGKRQVHELREIKIEELLGRAPVPPKEELMQPDIHGKVVLVTGAGGSIGSELCRQIAKQAPSKLVLLEIAEYNLYCIEGELKAAFPELPLIPLLGDVKDARQVAHLLKAHKVDTVYHAAAYKHVPLVEGNMLAGIHNNVLGTANMVKLANQCGVKKFVLVSTDKAVRPTNVMGASKRLAELCVQAMADADGSTECAIVRFGNVLGSSGSVVPLFTRQIKAGGPITITHPDVVRYFMTIPEAAQLVIQAGAMGKNGEVFVLDMGEPVRILDMAHNMAHLMGHSIRSEDNPEGDLEIQVTGLRPGEKLYEELLVSGTCSDTQHPLIMSEKENRLPLTETDRLLEQLESIIYDNDDVAAKNLLLDAPLAYRSANQAPQKKTKHIDTEGKLTSTDNMVIA
ncbi:nucleoside-diphosphate sugar epimerase/dehydratase [Aliiglaciecola sp. CAU 1673]|uniref:polysaccharide biosynthesis protein n=1 Tax=Aliiglaciecola sp. CAU 1673 TaxID=3032595 RepID=UPI0023DA3778|nr:nucleoside-diphosphate sugar epimerase/dehydratase [Aliiglaciecola sp. CAU 1673]MDF2179794.1 nucleoside-diphosphate sugar epimerase/dehydratase [Aliiglaciecola sp. CAU 1673]